MNQKELVKVLSNFGHVTKTRQPQSFRRSVWRYYCEYTVRLCPGMPSLGWCQVTINEVQDTIACEGAILACMWSNAAQLEAVNGNLDAYRTTLLGLIPDVQAAMKDGADAFAYNVQQQKPSAEVLTSYDMVVVKAQTWEQLWFDLNTRRCGLVPIKAHMPWSFNPDCSAMVADITDSVDKCKRFIGSLITCLANDTAGGA